MIKFRAWEVAGGRTRRQRVVAVSAALGVALALAGCGGGGEAKEVAKSGGTVDWEAAKTAAKGEGALVVYSSQAGADDILKSFSKDYPGITVTVNRQPAVTLEAQIEQEEQAGVSGADVILQANTPWYPDAMSRGVLKAISIEPSNQEKYGKFEGTAYVPILRYPFMLGYNSKLGQKVQTIEDIADSAKKQGTTIGYLQPKASVYATVMYQMYEDKYPGILEKLAAQKHAFYDTTTTMGQSLGAGEVAYTVGQSPGVIPPLAKAGAPVGEVVATDGTTLGVEADAGIPAHTAHPNAALLFVNWLMTEKVQKQLVEARPNQAGYVTPASTGVKFDDISVYNVKDWPKTRVDEMRAKLAKLFGL